MEGRMNRQLPRSRKGDLSDDAFGIIIFALGALFVVGMLILLNSIGVTQASIIVVTDDSSSANLIGDAFVTYPECLGTWEKGVVDEIKALDMANRGGCVHKGPYTWDVEVVTAEGVTVGQYDDADCVECNEYEENFEWCAPSIKYCRFYGVQPSLNPTVHEGCNDIPCVDDTVCENELRANPMQLGTGVASCTEACGGLIYTGVNIPVVIRNDSGEYYGSVRTFIGSREFGMIVEEMSQDEYELTLVNIGNCYNDITYDIEMSITDLDGNVANAFMNTYDVSIEVDGSEYSTFSDSASLGSGDTYELDFELTGLDNVPDDKFKDYLLRVKGWPRSDNNYVKNLWRPLRAW